MKAPSRLDFTPEEIDALIRRLNNKCLEEGDYSLLTDILRAMIWLSFSLQEKELSIKRLRKIFGIKTESAKKLLELAHGKSLENNDLPDMDEDTEDALETQSKEENSANKTTEDSEDPKKGLNKKPEEGGSRKNHGHRSSKDYSQAKVIEIAHQTLKKGDRCSDCRYSNECDGNLRAQQRESPQFFSGPPRESRRRPKKSGALASMDI
jgi:hypothetical protein